jgi:hypothetical protein
MRAFYFYGIGYSACVAFTIGLHCCTLKLRLLNFELRTEFVQVQYNHKQTKIRFITLEEPCCALYCIIRGGTHSSHLIFMAL